MVGYFFQEDDMKNHAIPQPWDEACIDVIQLKYFFVLHLKYPTYMFILQNFYLIYLRIEISYSPPFKQTLCCGSSSLITWAYYLVFLFLTTNLCDADDENMKELCTMVDREHFCHSLLLCFLWGILPFVLSSVELTSHCDEDAA